MAPLGRGLRNLGSFGKKDLFSKKRNRRVRTEDRTHPSDWTTDG